MEFKDALREKRIEMNLTQKALAEKLGSVSFSGDDVYRKGTRGKSIRKKTSGLLGGADKKLDSHRAPKGAFYVFRRTKAYSAKSVSSNRISNRDY